MFMQPPKPGWYLWLPLNKSFILFKRARICLISEGGLPLLLARLSILDLTTDERKEKKCPEEEGGSSQWRIRTPLIPEHGEQRVSLERLHSVCCLRVLVSHRKHWTQASYACRSLSLGKLVIKSVRSVVRSWLYINTNITVPL